MVSFTTRGPANPIKAFGSAIFKSPNIAKDAVTPPVVGSVKIDIYGSPAAANWVNFAEVFAICINEKPASIMRAPPDFEIQIKGQ